MSNKVLTYTITISVVVHLLILGVIGRTSAAKPIELENLKLVKVDLVKTPDEIKLTNPNQPKPKPEAQPKPIEPAPQFVPPVKQMKSAPPPKPRPRQQYTASNRRPPESYQVASNRVPGNPGGAVNMGSTSSHGENLGASGTSAIGYVPNNSGGQGTGSGTGPGVGTPDPPAHADPGPGTSPAPAPPPPPPPQPKYVDMTVCAASGKRPNRFCDKKVSRSFREGDEPSATCNVCKEPEPVHVNRLADRAEPELVHDPKVQVPDSVIEDGVSSPVRVSYTIEADGSVSDVKVIDSSGTRAFDRAVVDAARKLKYKPAVQDGVPRAVKRTRKYNPP